MLTTTTLIMFVIIMCPYIQGAAFIRKDAGDYLEYCWDKTSDEKFEVKEPEAKKKKTEE